MFYDKIFFERRYEENWSMNVDVRTIVEQYKKKNNVVQQIRMTKQVQLIGESMMPILDPSKILSLFVSDCCNLKVGDVVVFEYKQSVVGVSVHRIIKKEKNIITTKGDNNLHSDESINSSAIIGKVEKALMQDMSIVPVKSSNFVACFSRLENRAVGLLSKRLTRIVHQSLIKAYKFFIC